VSSWGRLWPGQRPQEVKINVDSKRAEEELAAALTSTFRHALNSHQRLVFVCIGTDRSTGDSLGPITGTLLKARSLKNIHIYGTLENPVHATNLESMLLTLQSDHPDDTIVAVDACLGKSDHVGVITIGHGPLRPGAGVNKELPPVGNLHITGVVNVGGFMEYFVLQNTRLYLVYRLAEAIVSGIGKAIEQLESSRLKA
jgi:putative sporulation protein YyaC